MESEKKQQRFGALRAELTRCGYTQQELGIGIRRSLTYMNLRFNGKSQWELEDMYKIMAFLRLPVCELNKYFPRNGIEREASGRRGAQVFSAGNEALRAFRGEMAKETGHGKAL